MALGDKQRAAARARADANRPAVVGRGDGTGDQARGVAPPATPDLSTSTVEPIQAKEEVGGDWSRETRNQAYVRSGGWCEAQVSVRCQRRAIHLHHRKLRRHGDHRLVNGLYVCLYCHALIHGDPEKAYQTGMMVRRDEDPAIRVIVPGPW